MDEKLLKVMLSMMDEKDSIEIGSISKGGKVKVYFNADNMEEAKAKIDNVMELRRYAEAELAKAKAEEE